MQVRFSERTASTTMRWFAKGDLIKPSQGYVIQMSAWIIITDSVTINKDVVSGSPCDSAL